MFFNQPPLKREEAIVVPFTISWTTTGDVNKVRIEEGTSPEQIGNPVGEVSGITVMTVTGLDPNQRHYFRIKGGSGDGIIASERGVPQIGVLNFGNFAPEPSKLIWNLL